MREHPPDRITVFIEDDHPLVRLGLTLLLEQGGFPVCGEADSFQATLEQPALTFAQVALLDISLERESGVEELLDQQLPRVRRVFPNVLVRGDSAFDRASIRAVCVRHGAHFAVVARRKRGWMALAQSIPEAAWLEWRCPSRERADDNRRVRAYRGRRKGFDRRRAHALRRLYTTLRKEGQWVAEVSLPPTVGEPPCRLIILREEIDETKALQQRCLFKHIEYRFFVTNLPASFSAGDVVAQTYHRCDQENIIEQLKNELPM
jgi:hypothetical protein